MESTSNGKADSGQGITPLLQFHVLFRTIIDRQGHLEVILSGECFSDCVAACSF